LSPAGSAGESEVAPTWGHLATDEQFARPHRFYRRPEVSLRHLHILDRATDDDFQEEMPELATAPSRHASKLSVVD
jgi:hypothetical protein